MDSTDGCALERYASALSLLSNLPPPVPRVGQGRDSDGHLDGSGSGYGTPGPDQGCRMFHRWHLLKRQKRGACVGPTKRGKGSKIMVMADQTGLPIAVCLAAATPHEVTLVEKTLAQKLTRKNPQRLIGDRAYDSDPLDVRLHTEHRVQLIAPHKSNRVRTTTQDGRSLRRYSRRWKIERLNAWLQNFRRIVVRYEYKAQNFLGFIHLAIMLILLRNYAK